MKINRYSGKCKLCKAKWTTEESDRTKAYDLHELACPKYSLFLGARVGSKANDPRIVTAERYQMSVLYFSHIQIEGHFVADKVCDGRCMSATGHVCECSCGGSNHGAGAAA